MGSATGRDGVARTGSFTEAHPLKEASSLARPDPRRAAETLFASPTLVDLLVLLCREPHRRFYVNEIIRQSGRFPRSVQLALARLETSGLVRSEREGNVRFYRIVADHPFFPEVASICAKIPDVRWTLKRALGAVPEVRAAFLRTSGGEDAEVDLVVVGGEGARAAVERQVAEVAAYLGRAIHLQFFSSGDWAREACRERSYVRWLLAEERVSILGDDDLLGEAP